MTYPAGIETDLDRALYEFAFHALGIEDWRKRWEPSRNYFAQDPENLNDSAHLATLQAAGFVASAGKNPKLYGDLEFWRMTGEGIAAARKLHARLRKAAKFRTWSVYLREDDEWKSAGHGSGTTRSKARYDAWLRLREPLPDLKLYEIRVGRLL